MRRIAVISVHGSPLAQLGDKESGGMNVYVRELSRELGRRGLLVDVFTRWNHPSLHQVVEFGEGARLVHLRAGGLGAIDKNQVYYHLPEFLNSLRHFQQENGLQYDLIHSHYWLSGWVGCLLSQRWRVPHAVMFHTLAEIKNRARVGENESALRIETERKVLAGADRVIAASEHEKGQMVRLYSAPAHRIEVIPCGINLELFRPTKKAAARRRLGLERSRIALFVGRIEPLKGLDILLKAVAMLEDKADLQLLVVGGNPETDGEVRRVRRLAAELGIGDRVAFIGAVSQDKLPLYYSAADVCVMPSYYESFGMVAVEALACGVPVIASKVGGLQNNIRDGETGYLIPWRCPEAFAERLELLLGNDVLRRSFSGAARASVERYAWPNIAERVLSVYDSLWMERKRSVLPSTAFS